MNTRSALIVIDVQKGFDSPVWGPRNNADAEKNIARLLKVWRRTQRPIFHVKHMSREKNSPLRPGQPGNEIKDIARPQPTEPIIYKEVNSGFIGTDLEARLRKNRIDELVIVGLTTDHCVSTTARMAGNLGFKTHVISDATATFDRIGPDGTRYRAEEVHRVSLASLHNEFATVIDMRDLLEELGG